VFFSYAPHCQVVSLEFYVGGWKEGEVDGLGNVVADFSSKRTHFYCGNHIDEKEDEAKLSEAEAYLKGLVA
jgi:hypothetical protein